MRRRSPLTASAAGKRGTDSEREVQGGRQRWRAEKGVGPCCPGPSAQKAPCALRDCLCSRGSAVPARQHCRVHRYAGAFGGQVAFHGRHCQDSPRLLTASSAGGPLAGPRFGCCDQRRCKQPAQACPGCTLVLLLGTHPRSGVPEPAEVLKGLSPHLKYSKKWRREGRVDGTRKAMRTHGDRTPDWTQHLHGATVGSGQRHRQHQVPHGVPSGTGERRATWLHASWWPLEGDRTTAASQIPGSNVGSETPAELTPEIPKGTWRAQTLTPGACG